MIAEGSHTSGNGDRLQVSAILESPVSNGRHLVGLSVIGNGLGNDNIARIGRCVIRSIEQIRYFRF